MGVSGRGDGEVFGPNPLKQFITGKPTRFGCKIWILASYNGQLLACQMSVRKGVYQLWKKITFWRCVRCDVALHCECFYNYYVQEEEQ